jgi:hypothetical protein
MVAFATTQSKEPLAKSPVRQRGDDSITAYLHECALAFENPLRGSEGNISDPALETALVSLFQLAQFLTYRLDLNDPYASA